MKWEQGGGGPQLRPGGAKEEQTREGFLGVSAGRDPEDH